MNTHARASIVGLVLTLSLAAASLADPMRPLPTAASASAAAASNTITTTPRLAVPSAPVLGRLVAIRQDSQGRRQALIGERWVSVGDRLEGQAVVSSIDANAVVVHNGKSRTELFLLPPLIASSKGAAPARPQSAPSATAMAATQAAALAPQRSRASALPTP